MKRIAILTAGGDTPALNATIYGAVTEACRRKIEVLGLIRGYASLPGEKVPVVRLNPLYSPIPALDPTRGGTLIGSSRTYFDHESADLPKMLANLKRLKLDGLICIGGDGTINGMQVLADTVPCVLAPKTIDNDLGLNYPGEADDWPDDDLAETEDYELADHVRPTIEPEEIINYATPGYATAVFVVASSVSRLRTTAESHRRIAVVEVMGRQSGYIALGAAYGQPDLILIPEKRVDPDNLARHINRLYRQQQHAVIVVGEGVRGPDGQELGAAKPTRDPAGNIRYSGAAEGLVNLLQDRIDREMVEQLRPHEPSKALFFTRKVGHTQRGGRPILFDRFHAAQLGGHAVEMLAEGMTNSVATLQFTRRHGFHVGSVSALTLRSRSGDIRPRRVHPSFYDPLNMRLTKPGREYLKPIFTNAVGWDDLEIMRAELFAPSNLTVNYQSVTVDLNKRTEWL